MGTTKMAAGKLTLRQLGLLRRCLGPGGVAKAARMSGPLIQTRNGSTNDPAPWNYLWAPGKYPQTEEEMVAGAKRPGLKWWDDEDYKRDHGQVMGWDWYHTLEVGWDSCDYKDRHPPEEAFLIFSGIISVLVAITWLVSYFNADIMEIPQIMPKDPWSEKHKDKKWYTFEKPE